MLLSRLTAVDDNEQTLEAQSPLQRVVGIASFACFVCLSLIWWIASPVVKLLDVWWAELLVYTIIPISVTFIILYRSCWHQEIVGATRTCSLLLLSGAVLSGIILALGVIFSIAMFYSISFRDGFGGHP